MRYYQLVVATLYLLLFGYWQPLAAQPLVFKHLSIHEGLSQSPIFSIYQDSRGLIWIGSRDGLIRYDAYEFKTYYHKDSSRNNHRDIYTIIEGLNGDLLIGTPGGLTKFARNTESFLYIPQVPRSAVYKLLRTANDRLWVATQTGLLVSDSLLINGKPHFKTFLKQRTTTVFVDNKDNVWVGSKAGVTLLDRNGSNIPLPAPLMIDKSLAQAKVNVITQDKAGNIWIGTEDHGVFYYDLNTQTCTNFRHDPFDDRGILEDFIKDIYVNNDGRLWIATRNGLSILDTQNFTFINYQHQSEDNSSLSNNTIWNIMKDSAGSIWLTTFAGGINVYDPSNNNFANIGERVGQKPGLSHPVVTALLQDKSVGLWIGTDGGGLNYLDNTTGRFRYYVPTDHSHGKGNHIIYALAHREQGGIWIGTLNGLAYLAPGSQTFKYVDLSNTNEKIRVNALATDRDGIWIGTDFAGLKFLSNNGRLNSFDRTTKQVSSNHINALLRDKNNDIWIGTSEGLNKFNKVSGVFQSFRNQTSRQEFNSNDVLTLFQDSRGRLWVGTRNGLFLFDTEHNVFTSVNDQDHLQNKFIKSITEDGEGNLWLGTNHGIVKISFNSSLYPLNVNGYKVHAYTAIDGLASNQFSSNASLKTIDGDILLGGVNGITRFDPLRIAKNNFRAKVLITGLDIYGKPVQFDEPGSVLKQPIEETHALTLNYDQAYITFKFAALNYINTVNNQYAYKLEGLANDDWHYTGVQRFATYTNLTAGDYKFRVKAANNDGVWNEQEAVIAIKVLPPWWLTWWAYLLYFLIAVIGLCLIIRFVRIKTRLENDLQIEHLEKIRQEELHQTKLNFFTNISHEIRTPLTLISAPIEKLLTDYGEQPVLGEQLTSIHQNTGRLLQLINELMDFRKAESGKLKLSIGRHDITKMAGEIFTAFEYLAQKRGIHYTCHVPAHAIYLYYDNRQLEKVFFNLLSNAFKFTHDGGSISLALKELPDQLEASVTDNGRGIPYESQAGLFTSFYQVNDNDIENIGSGIGLALSKSIVMQHGGTMEVKSRPETPDVAGNTCFTVRLKYGFAHYAPDEVDLYDNKYLSEWPSVLASETDNELPSVNATDIKKEHTLLLAEDNAEVRRFLRRSLEGLYEILEAADGRAGLELALEYMPDLVISDVMMPIMNGLELCRQLKLNESTSHIPVILLTARAAYLHQVEGLETGADLYVTKPFHVRMLELSIHNLLCSRVQMRKKFSQQVTLQPHDVIIESADEKFLQKLMTVVETHMDKPEFGVDALASEIGMSQSVLYRKIKAITDLTVADFVKSIRLKKAAMLLGKGQLSIADVAYMVGFSNRKHFSREFKKQFGKSPTDYSDNFQD